MFGDLDIRPTLNSETKHSSLNCPNHVRRIVRLVKNWLCPETWVTVDCLNCSKGHVIQAAVSHSARHHGLHVPVVSSWADYRGGGGRGATRGITVTPSGFTLPLIPANHCLQHQPIAHMLTQASKRLSLYEHANDNTQFGTDGSFFGWKNSTFPLTHCTEVLARTLPAPDTLDTTF